MRSTGSRSVATWRTSHQLAALVRDGADSTDLLTAVRDDIGLGASLDALDRGRPRPEGSSHGDDLTALGELAVLQPDPRALPGWLADRLARADASRRDLARAAADPVNGADAVTVSTVHRVKGREWDIVAVVGLRAGLVPHRLCDDVEEERRVLHVALTRARQHLVLVTDPERPSPFLPELLGTIRPPHAHAPDEEALLEALRSWRRQRATTDRVPAFLVAHDRTLSELARRRPQDPSALRTCHGIGPAKVSRYGSELLMLLRTRPGPYPADGRRDGSSSVDGDGQDERELVAALRAGGHRLTGPRRAVWAALSPPASGGEAHLSVDEVVERTQALDAGIDRATAYRVLALLEELGLVRASQLDAGDAVRWERAHPDEHFHLRCTACGTVEHHVGTLVATVREHLDDGARLPGRHGGADRPRTLRGCRRT
jgi:Fe2+ or Zn2+ uptake regulation protein